MKILIITLLCSLPFFSLSAKCGRGGGSPACGVNIEAAPGTLVIPAEQWTRLWLDEIVAHDLYTALDKMTRKPIFQNISKAEMHHRTMIEALLTSAGIELPDAPKAGDYPDPELQNFYAEKLTSGSASETGAFKSGEAFEIQDISELEAALQTEGISEAETQVLTALRDASQRHLNAFQRQLGNESL